MKEDPRDERGYVFATALGWMSLRLAGPRVVALRFGHRTPTSARRAVSDAKRPWVERDGDEQPLVARLQAYADGAYDDFRDVLVSWEPMTMWQRRVMQRCREIPYGQTQTYAELARQVHSPRAARAVGNCMAMNYVPLIIPCHRVVPAGGRLGGFSAEGGVDMKRRLLDLEAAHAPAGAQQVLSLGTW